MDYKNIISERIKGIVNIEEKDIENAIEIPKREEMGDYAFPCFKLSKFLRKSPNIIASDLSQKINKDGFEKVECAGPYLNFFIDKGKFNKNAIEKILSDKDRYGSSDIGKGKNITIDYSSPNIAKPFHVGHMFTTVIGNSLYKILSFEGYNCIGINHLGDWGTQFGKLISAYKRWSDEDELEKHPIDELLRIYVKFHKEAEKDPSLNDEARHYFKKLEDGSKEETELWQRFKDLSLKEFNKIYKRLGVKFDHYTGESFYNDKMDSVIEEIDKKGLLKKSNGAEVVMLDDYNMPPCIIRKSDGATIYATRDLAAAIYRKKTYNFYKSIYVVGTPQTLHFKQVFKVLKLMGYDWYKDCIHIGFGLVKFADRKLSTRNGDVIMLEELLNDAVSKTSEIINEKNPDLENKEEAAEKIGIGAVIFTYLKNGREKDIVFDWKEMLSFDGETGPYVQYTYARGKSILRKIGSLDGEADYSGLSDEEFRLIKLLGSFKEAILNAIDKYEPSILTRHVIEIAKMFNKCYNTYNIMNTENIMLKKARVNMVEAACQVIKNGLALLGIDVVERM